MSIGSNQITITNERVKEYIINKLQIKNPISSIFDSQIFHNRKIHKPADHKIGCYLILNSFLNEWSREFVTVLPKKKSPIKNSQIFELTLEV